MLTYACIMLISSAQCSALTITVQSYHNHDSDNENTVRAIPSTGDQYSQLIVATLVPSTPICLFFNLAKLQCKQTVVTDFCIGFVNKIHIIGKGMIKETWIAKIKEIGC